MDKIVRVEKLDMVKSILFEFNEIFSPSLTELIEDLDLYAEKLLNKGIIYAALVDEVVQGFISFYANDHDEKMAYISQIAVNPNVQRKGIGKSLIEICERVSRHHGMERLRLQVYKKNNTALRFYTLLGFYGVCNVNENTIYMEKRLI